MQYRKLRNGEEISVIGIGSAHLHEMNKEETNELLTYAKEQGVNFLDLVMSYEKPLENLGYALRDKRDAFILQMHLGMAFPGGQYMRTRDLALVKESFEKQMKMLGTEYADILLIHYVDEEDDFDAVFSSGMYEYAKQLKQEGKTKYIGFASHDVEICRRFIEKEEVDVCMFSINAAYDLDPVGNLPFDEYNPVQNDEQGSAAARMAFYRECEKRGIVLTAMKPYGGGLLLNDNTPLGQKMSTSQCIQYALDRPAVVSCLVGARNKKDLMDALSYNTATKEEKDYAFIADMPYESMKGICVYCNHCLPCPAQIGIAAVHKYLDLYLAGDLLAKEHYKNLTNRAKDCIACGSCEKNCPFGVKIIEKMQLADAKMER
ncbi:MAG: aldo/keto reductase [Christensenellaceae bacterium]|jgi:predicted aldo/keto reductase-like oxidoreductase